jgi:hypothetical protein
MRNGYLELDDIEAQLDQIGDTGNAKTASDGGIYVQREENSDWQYVGCAANRDEAAAFISSYFEYER